MPFWLTPGRRRGTEILDDPATPPDVRARAMADVAWSNTLFGGTRAVLGPLREVLRHLPARAVLVDVGTGTADIPERTLPIARAAHVELSVIGVDIAEHALRLGRHRLGAAVAADARRLPFADASADVVTCSQVLHHFFDDDTGRLIAELHRVSRGWVIVSDLRRSWLAVAAWWLATSILRFHVVTRLDGMTSVLRGFTAPELDTLVHRVTGVRPSVRGGMFWRLIAVWRKPAPAMR